MSDLDAALAQADDYADRLECPVGQVTPSQRMCVTLARAVRALLRDLASLEMAHAGCVAPEQVRQEREARVTAEAELAALKGRTCEPCYCCGTRGSSAKPGAFCEPGCRCYPEELRAAREGA